MILPTSCRHLDVVLVQWSVQHRGGTLVRAYVLLLSESAVRTVREVTLQLQ